MADVITRLRVESSEYDSKIKRAQQGIMQLEQSLRNSSRSFADATKEEVAYVRALGNMQTVSNTAKGKVNELTSAFTELSLTYKRMSDQEKQSPIGQALSQSLNQLKTRINETKGQLSEVNKELGNTKTEGDAAGGSLGSFSQILGVGVGKLGLYAAAIGAAKEALDILKEAFFTSETNVDDWGRTVAAAQSVYETFLISLNSGSFDNFFNGLDGVIAKAKEAYNAIDELNTVMTIINPERVKLQARQQELRGIIRRQGATSEAGQAAAAELKTIEPQLQRSYRRESELNYNAFRSAVESRLKEGGINLNQKSFDILMRSFSDEAVYNQLKAGARGTAGHLTGNAGGSMATGNALNYVADTRNTNQKLLDLFTDEWRQQNSRLLTASFAAQSGASSVALQNARYLRESSSGGGSKGGKGGGAVTNAILSVLPVDELQVATVGTTTSMKELQARLNAYNAQLSTATTSGEYAAATQGIADTKKAMSLQQTALKMGWSIEDTAAFQDQLDEMAKNIQPVQIPAELKVDGSASTTAKDTAEGWKSAAQAVNQVSGALAGLEDPAAKIAGIVGQAIANIALGFATATAKDGKLGVFGWISAIAGGLATMISTISAIKSATAGSYAEGGIVPGNSYSGDRLTANVNSGELILNAAQQNTLASQLMGAGSAMYLEAVVSGEQLRFVLNNNSRRRSRGEYVTTLMRN